MNKFPEECFKTLGYYVYRLIDPRDNKTFYVGKGKKNRVFDHVNDELRFSQTIDEENDVEDELSAKMQTIRDIREAGLQVKHVIHRYGMNEKEALEVEAALIDIYSELGELTNKQSGHDADRGFIDADDFIIKFSATEYNEPENINYVIIKTKYTTVENCDNSLYEASRKAWSLSLDRVKDIKYVLATINGLVKEVYEVKNWYPSNEPGRVEFNGHIAEDDIRKIFINKLLPQDYRKQGNASAALYKIQNSQLKNADQQIEEYSNEIIKIGQLAKTKIPELIQKGNVSTHELELMQTSEYSKKAFHINFPLLADRSSNYPRERYYSESNLLININSKSYVLCSQWFETNTNNDRPFLEAWIKTHDFDNI